MNQTNYGFNHYWDVVPGTVKNSSSVDTLTNHGMTNQTNMEEETKVEPTEETTPEVATPGV